MPSSAVGRALLIFLSYVAIAVAFAWPLPAHLTTALPGAVAGDTAVYVWNLWVFRHEVVVNHAWPFATSQIAAASGAPLPLLLNNYTAFTNAIGLVLVPWLGTVAAYNVLMMLSQALSASGMYVLAHRCSRDRAAAWISGIVFGFAPFMVARSMGHFSLVQAAPLPVFAWLLLRIYDERSWKLAIAAAAVVAWAYVSDPYYAVYCIVMLACMLAYVAVTVRRSEGLGPRVGVRALDVLIVALAALIAAIEWSGGGSIELLGARISMRSLYTPMLVLTVLVLARVAIATRPRLSFHVPARLLDWRIWIAGALTGLVLVAPVAWAMLSQPESAVMGPPVLWRSSAPGVDVLALLMPNPFHPLAPASVRAWIAALPLGLVENVASIPWTAIAVIACGALLYRLSLPAGWAIFTGWFALLALGPFVHVAGYNLHVPGPWALLRYVPVIGAARAPTRFSVLVLMGVAVMMAMMLAAIRARVRRPAALALIVAAVALFELMPVPREVDTPHVPAFLQKIRDDGRQLNVLTLPFGLRDGLVSHGLFTPPAMFLQTVHEKPILGAYVSRLPGDILERGPFAESRVPHALMALSAGAPLSDEDREALTRDGRAFVERARVGWVIVDRTAARQEVERAAVRALDLRQIAVEGPLALYEPAAR